MTIMISYLFNYTFIGFKASCSFTSIYSPICTITVIWYIIITTNIFLINRTQNHSGKIELKRVRLLIFIDNYSLLFTIKPFTKPLALHESEEISKEQTTTSNQRARILHKIFACLLKYYHYYATTNTFLNTQRDTSDKEANLVMIINWVRGQTIK